MATFTTFQDFKEQMPKGVHQFGTHTYKWALTNSAPAGTETGISGITQITGANGYTTGGTAATLTVSETGGTATIAQSGDVTFTASGGTMATFRYAVLYNDTATSPADAVVGYIDNGSAVSLADTQSWKILAGNVFTLAG